MTLVAIYSLHHSAVGKSTQRQPYTAAAHARYVTRPGAMSRLEGARMPVAPASAIDWLCQAEDTSRANARIIDKVTLALPRELNAAQRVQLVRSFAEDVTMGKAPWLAAYHDKGKDESNPHCHLIIRDRDPETGKRVMGMSEHGSTQRLRLAWERHANAALELAGRQERIDHRTLKAQGIDRAPTIHEGPKARAMEGRGARPVSRERAARNMPKCRTRTRRINYPQIDGSRSRPGYNRMVREGAGDYWAAIDADQQRRELETLREIHRPTPSVEGGILIRFPNFQTVTQSGVNAGVHLGDTPRTLGIPFRPLSLDLRQAVFEPATNGIAGREGQYQLADALGKRSNLDAKQSHYNHSIWPLTSFCKENKMSVDDETMKRHEMELSRARFYAENCEARYNNIMNRSYLEPEMAAQRMEKYRSKHGSEALYEKLQGNSRKTAFGRRPGSILSKDGYTPGASARQRDSHIAREGLPSAVRDHHQAQTRLKAAETAYEGAKNKYGAQPSSSSTSQQSPNMGSLPVAGRSPDQHVAPQRAPHMTAQPSTHQQRAPDTASPAPQAQRAPHMNVQTARAPAMQATPVAQIPKTPSPAPAPAVTPQQMAAKTVPKKDKEFQP